MPIIGIDGHLTEQLIKSRWSGGVDGLVDAWMASSDNKVRKRPPPNRSTIYRWLQNGALPKSGDDFLVLCALLDVDPLGLLVASDGDSQKAIEHLLVSVQLEQWRHHSLRFMEKMFGRQTVWPPPEFAKNHFRREWNIKEFSHDPASKANYYATIELQCNEDVIGRRPQTVHFAYFIPGFFRNRWLQFGIVIRHGVETRLVHINGHSDRCEGVSLGGPSLVQTWFGPGPAVFRAASLHPFDIFIETQRRPAGACVRFPG